ncbi:MAG: lamin tail domain-containing protein [Candidatus Bathyarchaeia archaeon]
MTDVALNRIFFSLGLVAITIASGAFSNLHVINFVRANPTDHVLINEFEQDPPGSDVGMEWVELYNPTDSPVDISGWSVEADSNHPSTAEYWVIAPSSILEPRGYITSFGLGLGGGDGLWLDQTDEILVLFDNLGSIIDVTPQGVRGGPGLNGGGNDDGCWARYPNGVDTDSTSDWKWQLSTMGQSNGGGVSITITSLPEGSGFVNVDGSAIVTPGTFTWIDGETHNLEAISPVSGGSGVRYVWVSWSDGGAQAHTYTTPSSGQTVTANYKTQFYITVTSSYGSPTSSEWVDERQDYATSVTSPDGDYKCDGFKIDGGELQPGTRYTFANVQGPHTIGYVWNAPNPPPEPSHPVGGVLAPTNKLLILAPYLVLALLVGTAVVVFTIRKRHKEQCTI